MEKKQKDKEEINNEKNTTKNNKKNDSKDNKKTNSQNNIKTASENKIKNNNKEESNNNKKLKESNKKEKELKLNFIQKLNISVVSFEHYFLIAADGWKRAIKYLAQLLLIFSFILACCVTYKSNQTLNEICDYAKNKMPNFGVKEGSFWIDSEEPVVLINDKSTKVVLGNSESASDYIDETKDSRKDLIIVNKNSINVRNDYSGEVSYSFDNLSVLMGSSEITKNDIIQIISNKKIVLIIFIYSFLAVFITYFISMLIDILALSIVGHLLSRIIVIPLKYSAIFGMATSAMSLPIILTLCYIIANLITGFKMAYFQIMITVISYIYMISTLMIMKSNLISGDSEKKEKKKKNREENREEPDTE
ncbi:MAG: DUF1189 domain-containing protein [Clostridia bacterium]|nr:DUF1189 domain-containing protein [Clostridia bacterium]